MAQRQSELFDPEIPVIEAIRERDPEALSELMRRQGRWVRGVIYGALGRRDRVDDVAQQVWLRIWNEAEQLEDVTRWRAWIYRIARNASLDTGRRIRRERRLGLEVREQARPGDTAPPERELMAEEERQRMLDAIDALPAMYREPFVLKHLENWSYREIGETLGLPVDTVETRLTRARRKLREQLRKLKSG